MNRYMKFSMKQIVATLLLVTTTSWAGEDAANPLSGRILLADELTPAQNAQVILFDLSNLSVQGIGETDGDGRFTFAVDFLTSPTPALPGSFVLLHNFPNPFNPSTTIPYELHRAAPVRLEIFNSLGQQIATLIDATQPAGYHRAVWNGRDDRGRGVAAGIYIYRLTVDGLSKSQRMVMIDGKGTGAFSSDLPTRGDFPNNSSAPPTSHSFGLVVAGAGLETSVFPEITLDADSHHLEFEVARAATGVAPKPAAGGTSLVGDVNDDGVVNVVDALIIATYEINPDIVLPNGGYIALGDVNGDGNVNIVDALMVATYGVDPGNPSLPVAIGSVVETPNRPPRLEPIGNRAISAGVQLTIELFAEDLDGDPLVFSMSGDPRGASLEGRIFSWTPEPDQVGSFPVTFVAEDGEGGKAEETTSLYTPELVAELPGGESMEFAWIEPGTYIRGTPPDEPGRDRDEGPQHEVVISQGFYIGKYELTQGQWIAVMGNRPWASRANVLEDARRPAVHFKFAEVNNFTHKLNELAGERLYRLLTEGEWEYAARAGTTTIWSFGDDESLLGEYAWYVENTWNAGAEQAQPVGLKLPNPWGLYDMHGNVGEWVSDLYDEYSESGLPQVDPTGGELGIDHVVRGGSFARYPLSTRSGSRSALIYPTSDRPTVGTRILRIR